MLAALTGVGIGWARGGRVGALGDVAFKNLSLLAMAVVPMLIARLVRLPPSIVRVLLAVGYMGALVVLWQNRRLPWVLVVFVGLALNSLVMLLNGGRMPVTAQVLGSVALGADDPHYVLAAPATRLASLGDVLPVRVGGLGAVLSPGDLLIALGLAGFVQRQMRSDGPPRGIQSGG